MLPPPLKLSLRFLLRHLNAQSSGCPRPRSCFLLPLVLAWRRLPLLRLTSRPRIALISHMALCQQPLLPPHLLICCRPLISRTLCSPCVTSGNRPVLDQHRAIRSTLRRPLHTVHSPSRQILSWIVVTTLRTVGRPPDPLQPLLPNATSAEWFIPHRISAALPSTQTSRYGPHLSRRSPPVLFAECCLEPISRLRYQDPTRARAVLLVAWVPYLPATACTARPRLTSALGPQSEGIRTALCLLVMTGTQNSTPRMGITRVKTQVISLPRPQMAGRDEVASRLLLHSDPALSDLQLRTTRTGFPVRQKRSKFASDFPPPHLSPETLQILVMTKTASLASQGGPNGCARKLARLRGHCSSGKRNA